MMIAASTGFRQLREQRCEQDQRRQHEHPGGQRRDGRRRTGRLVQRARGEAGRYRHPLEHAGADVRHSLRDRLLIHVDAVAVPGREYPSIAGGLREPDQQQRNRSDRDLREVVREQIERRELRGRQPARHGPHERHAVRAEIEHVRREQAADDEHQRSGNLRRRETQPEDHRKRDDADDERRPMDVAQAADPRRQLPPRRVALGGRSRQLRELTDDDLNRSTRQEAGHDRLREKLRNPTHPEHAEQQEQHAGDQRDRRHQLRRLLAAETGRENRAPGDGRERGARTGRDLPRRAEQRVQ